MLAAIFQSTFKSLEKTKEIYAKAKKIALDTFNVSEEMIPRQPWADTDIKQGNLE